MNPSVKLKPYQPYNPDTQMGRIKITLKNGRKYVKSKSK